MVAYLVLIVAGRQTVPSGAMGPQRDGLPSSLPLLTVGAGVVGSVVPDCPPMSRVTASTPPWSCWPLGLAWGCYHGLLRKHTLPDLHDTIAPLDGEPTKSSHLL